MSTFRLIDSYRQSFVVPISNAKELIDNLHTIARNGHRVVLLHSPDHGTLTLGVGNPCGFVEYMKPNAAPPYLIAVNNSTKNGGFIEFDSGGTLTPVSTRHCINFDQVVDIAAFFLKNGKLSAAVYWENV
jgi:Immunity protein Imm1